MSSFCDLSSDFLLPAAPIPTRNHDPDDDDDCGSRIYHHIRAQPCQSSELFCFQRERQLEPANDDVRKSRQAGQEFVADSRCVQADPGPINRLGSQT